MMNQRRESLGLCQVVTDRREGCGSHATAERVGQGRSEQVTAQHRSDQVRSSHAAVLKHHGEYLSPCLLLSHHQYLRGPVRHTSAADRPSASCRAEAASCHVQPDELPQPSCTASVQPAAHRCWGPLEGRLGADICMTSIYDSIARSGPSQGSAVMASY